MKLTNNKKIFIVGGITILTLLLATSALAQNPDPTTRTGISRIAGVPTNPNELLTRVGDFVRWAYILFFILAVLFVLIAAYTYLTAAGNQEKIDKAKTMLIYSAVAVAVALMAIVFNTIIGGFVGGGGAIPNP
ncbi:hypothetical protein HYV91_02565 [Candidatus Wolfebacteria bacterium]|nr:hypothetical protein [Candidatus Wolfebacteria bacterium]